MAKRRPDRPVQNFIALGIGILVFVVLTAIPVIGSILNAIVILLELGVLWSGWRHLGLRGDTAPERSLAAL